MNTVRRFIKSIVLVATVAVAVATPLRAADDPAVARAKEQELLGVLRSDASGGEKALACKNLAIYGSDAAVADLAGLLSDPHLHSWARIALEAIPGTAADEALRTAADSLEGLLLVGTINSIGVRSDANAVDILTVKLQAADATVASAAAVALGRIGNGAAAVSLRKALPTAAPGVRDAVAEGCVLCAERLLTDGQLAGAVEIYDELRAANVHKQRILEATRGAILARQAEGLPLLIEQFRSQDKSMFQLALSTAREFPGTEIDRTLADEIEQATPGRAALIIQAMADRQATVVLAAVLKAAGEGPSVVRASAIDALKRVGDESCLSVLLDISVGTDPDLARASKETLAGLSGENVDTQIVARLPDAKGKSYPLLIELVGQRRIDAVPELLQALEHSDKVVRHAALIALGETVSLKRLSILISQVVSPKYPDDVEVAQLALKAASVRMPDREACAAELTAALDRSSGTTQSTLLEILADVGGSTALQTLGRAAKSSDDQLQDTSSRLLGKWNSVDAAPVLLDLARNTSAEKYQVRALRGYLGLARKFAMPEPQRVEMCRSAVDVARRVDEQRLVLDVLSLHPSVAGLGLAIELKQVAALKADATAATLVIAQKLGSKGVDVSKLLTGTGLDKVKLEIVKAEYGAGSATKDVTGTVQTQAGDLPLITLASSSYNTSFGGDPAPGTVKRLKIQYRMNGKSGEASFAENDLIILPMPR